MFMADSSAIKVQAPTRAAAEVIRSTPVTQALNGICYATLGETGLAASELERMVAAVPQAIASALSKKAYYFVPLTVSEGDETLIAERYDVALSDKAVCHRNLGPGDAQCVFISTRLMDDKFSVAFELYINVGHAFVDRAGVSQAFSELVWGQAEEKARELSEPHVTKSGLPRSFEGSIDRDPEKLTQDEVRDQAELAPDDRETHREEVELDLMEQHESERGKRLA